MCSRNIDLVVVLTILAVVSFTSQLTALPITGGTGPGGIETTVGGGGTNLKLWYKSENLQDTAGSVSSWLDSSGNSFTASPGGAAPNYTASSAGLNGLPAATFTGAVTGTQILNVTGAASGILQNVPGASMFMVVDHTSASGNQNYFDASVNGNINFRSSVRVIGGVRRVTARRLDADTAVHIGAGATPATPLVATGVLDYVNRDGFRYTDGALDGQDLNMLTAGNTENTTSDFIAIGNVGGETIQQQVLGDFGELVVMNRAVSAAERIIIDNYLSSKFNAGSVLVGSDRSLAIEDNYVGDTTANGNFDFDVFGTGQAAGGTQVLSTGAAGFGIDLTSATLIDGDWALAGRNSLSSTNSLVTTDLGSSDVESRWDREWFVDATGSFDADLAFDFVDADFASHVAGSYALLYRSTQGNDFSVLNSNPQLDGDTIVFQLTAGELNDGYYTLGLAPVPEPSSALLLGIGALGLVTRRRRSGRSFVRRKTSTSVSDTSVPAKSSQGASLMPVRFSFAQVLVAVAVVLVAGNWNSATAGLVQYWTFDDGVGTSAANDAFGGNVGVLTNFDSVKVNDGGSDTPPSDWVGSGLPAQLSYSTGALDFEGGTATGDYVDGGAINLSSTGSGGTVTVSMWLKPTALNGDDRLYGQNGTTISTSEGGAPHVLANGQVQIWDGAAWQSATSPGALAVATWTHLAFVWDSGSVTTYANGAVENTVTADFDFLGVGHEFGIGNRFRSTHGTTFDGVIDDVSIWSIALSSDLVADLASGVSPHVLLPVPEPSSLMLLGLGALGMLSLSRRQRAAGKPSRA